jgi:SOUL heme-binding protein
MTSQILARPAQFVAQPASQAAGVRRRNASLTGTLLKRFTRLLPTDWRILARTRPAEEFDVATLGDVEIRHTIGGCLALTCVKGDIALARETALRRLDRYVSGENRGFVPIAIERPILQQRKAAGLWLVAVRLGGILNPSLAPEPCTPKVKIVRQEPTTWAVLRHSGKPSERAIDSTEIAIMDAIARTRWFATGPAVCRINTPKPLLPFAGSFEVAVPVTCLSEQTATPDRAEIMRPAHQSSRAVH